MSQIFLVSIKGQEKFQAWEPNKSQSSIYEAPLEHTSHTEHVTAAVCFGQSVVVGIAG